MHTPDHIDCPACEAARHSLSEAGQPYRSEQSPHAGRREAAHAGQGVPPAAQVFSNYVFVPAAGHPDGNAGTVRTHGAALLVFADQPSEQIKLRAGYVAHVTGDAVLVPAENVGDEIVSGHKGREQGSGNRDQEMTKEMTTQQRKSIWPAIMAVLGAFLFIAYIGGVISNHAAKKQQGELKAALDSGQLDMAAAFQGRCGVARWTKQTKDGTELHYLIGATDYFVTFAGGAPRFQQEHTAWSGNKPSVYRTNMDAETALGRLGCK